MSDEFTGPPWAADWTKTAAEYRDSLAPPVKDLVLDAVIDLATSQHPYRDHGLDTSKVSIEPARSTQPRGPHILYFDRGRGWLRYVFIHRTAEPQIVIETLFWQ